MGTRFRLRIAGEHKVVLELALSQMHYIVDQCGEQLTAHFAGLLSAWESWHLQFFPSSCSQRTIYIPIDIWVDTSIF